MSTTTSPTPTITCDVTLYNIGTWTILRLPKEASALLPARGQVMVEGTINGVHVRTPFEPDGNFSHWLHMDDELLQKTGVKAGDTVEVTLESSKDWTEPVVPQDWKEAVEADPETRELWQKITPLARWEWIRWIRSNGKDEMRKKHIEVGISKMKAGERRPCCWNRNLSTEPTVSKHGVLLDPTDE